MALLGSLNDYAPAVHPEAWIAPGAVVVGRVTLGRAASVWYGSVLRADDDEIVVGPECNIQDLCCLHVDAGQPVLLEERVSLGHHATVHGAHVEAGALIGIGAIVLGQAQDRGRRPGGCGLRCPARYPCSSGGPVRRGARTGGQGAHPCGSRDVRQLGHQVRGPGGPPPRGGLDRLWPGTGPE